MNLNEIHQKITVQVKKFYQHMNLVESNNICLTPTVQFRDESGLHEFNT